MHPSAKGATYLVQNFIYTAMNATWKYSHCIIELLSCVPKERERYSRFRISYAKICAQSLDFEIYYSILLSTNVVSLRHDVCFGIKELPYQIHNETELPPES